MILSSFLDVFRQKKLFFFRKIDSREVEKSTFYDFRWGFFFLTIFRQQEGFLFYKGRLYFIILLNHLDQLCCG